MQLIELANTDVIAEVTTLGTARIGGDHVPFDVLRQRIAQQPGCAAVRRTRSGDIAAATVIYSLTGTATAAVLDGHVQRGSNLTVDMLAPRGAGASLYIGSVASTPGRGPLALGLLGEHLVHLVALHGRTTWLFGRAATPAGERLLERFHFSRIDRASEIRALPITLPLVAHVRRVPPASADVVRLWRPLLGHRNDGGAGNDDLETDVVADG